MGQMALIHCQVHSITYKMFNSILTKFLDLTWFSGNIRDREKQGISSILETIGGSFQVKIGKK